MLSESRCQTFSNSIPTSEAINDLAFVPKISTKDENLFWFGYRENSINSASEPSEVTRMIGFSPEEPPQGVCHLACGARYVLA